MYREPSEMEQLVDELRKVKTAACEIEAWLAGMRLGDKLTDAKRPSRVLVWRTHKETPKWRHQHEVPPAVRKAFYDYLQEHLSAQYARQREIETILDAKSGGHGVS